jgi:hypothetical protein
MGSYLNFNNYNPYTGNANIQRNQSRNEYTATTLAVGEEGGGGGYNPQPFPFPFNPEPRLTTLADGEEGGGGGYNPQPFPFPFNPEPRMTTLAMGEEGGGWYPPPPIKPTTTTITNVGDVNLQDAQKVHKDADQLDGKLDNKASANQFNQLKTKLTDELKQVQYELKRLTPDVSSIEKGKALKMKEATLQKELETIQFLITNSGILARPIDFGSMNSSGSMIGISSDPSIAYSNLEVVADQVNETPNRWNADDGKPKKLISAYDLEAWRSRPVPPGL